MNREELTVSCVLPGLPSSRNTATLATVLRRAVLNTNIRTSTPPPVGASSVRSGRISRG